MSALQNQRESRRGVITRIAAGARLGKRCESGVAAIEFAIIFPVFVLLVMAMIEFGRLFWVQVSLRHAVEQTARNAMTEYTRESFIKDSTDFASWFSSTWETVLEAAAPDESFGFNPSGITWNASISTDSGVDYVQIDASYTFTFLFPVIPSLSSTVLTAQSKTPLIGQY